MYYYFVIKYPIYGNKEKTTLYFVVLLPGICLHVCNYCVHNNSRTVQWIVLLGMLIEHGLSMTLIDGHKVKVKVTKAETSWIIYWIVFIVWQRNRPWTEDSAYWRSMIKVIKAEILQVPYTSHGTFQQIFIHGRVMDCDLRMMSFEGQRSKSK